MAYNESTPASINESFSVSQPKIKANFEEIKIAFEKDHVAFDDGTHDGKHKQLTMPAQTTDSTTAANERAIYCKNNAATLPVPALWIQAANTLVAADGVDITTDCKSNNGWARLPSGLLIKWGYELAAAGTGTYAFPVGVGVDGVPIPVFQHIYGVTISPYGDGGLGSYDYMPYMTAFNTTSISIFGSARTANVARTNCHYRYLAIGD